ncbi:MAG: hypothetical protein VKM01_08020 [Cyanobacteriota bacterium]|jgi:Tfp pilus assembly PilM family ATPase|nr:hypothetical protein [Cyanobacteriota bacterium]
MVFSQARDRLRGWRAQLLPPQVLMVLDDGAVRIGALPLGGRPRLQRAWSLALPDGTCSGGMPQQVTALGDFIGDFLVEQGLVQAQVRACLPPVASRWRLLHGTAAGALEDPAALQRQEERLGLDDPLEALYVDVLPLADEADTALLVAARRDLVQAWHEVFDLAGADLVQLEPAQTCEWRAMARLWRDEQLTGAGDGDGATTTDLVLALDTRGSWLWLAQAGRPVADWWLPALSWPFKAAALAELAGELQERQRFWDGLQAAASRWRCWLHGPLAEQEGLLEALRDHPIAAQISLLDPLQRGWLRLPAKGERQGLSGPQLVRLQGLLAGVPRR